MINLNEIYAAQSYTDSAIVEEKRENKDYEIQVMFLADDDKMIPMVVDGHHSLEAAKVDGVDPIVKIVEIPDFLKTVEDYVIALNGLSNPRNIMTGEELW